MKRIGFLGYGLRSETMMNAFRALKADMEVACVADPRAADIREKVKGDPFFAHTVWFEDGKALLQRDELDGIFLGTRCSLHTPLACEVLKRDIPLFLEKPVCISPEQYIALRDAGEGKEDRVVVSFPLRLTVIVEEMRHIVTSGQLGRLVMAQAVNNVPYGSVYYHSWYRDPRETGGLFLQKTTHDIDYISYLMGERPVKVYAQTEKTYFTGNHPAGLHCPDCAEYRSCVESSYVVEHLLKEEVQGDACAFAVDTGNEDMASAIFTMESGALVSYNQIFLVKKGAARRGVRLIGTEGSAEFDFYTGEIREDRYRTPQTVTHRFAAGGQHFGGDEQLALEFLRVMEGEPSRVNLTTGLESAAACLAARRSAKEGKTVEIKY